VILEIKIISISLEMQFFLGVDIAIRGLHA